MAMEMSGLKMAAPDKKNKNSEKTVSELEGENFKSYVIEILNKQGKTDLVKQVEEDKIPLVNLEAIKAIETGNLAEKSNADYNVVDHMTKRAEMFIEELKKNKAEYLN